MTLAYDGWNQTATLETVQTLRTCNGTDGDDRTPKICTSATPPLNAMTTGFSHSNSDVSLETRPTPECALTIRSAPTGETAAIIDNPSAHPPQNHPTPPPRGMTLTYVSLFSGIEAFSVAASRIADVDWRPVFFSEIDPFPCAVLAHHLPSVPNLGDVCKIRVETRTNPTTNTTEKVITNGNTTIPFPRMGVDILAGGSPCQDVSVAGLRRGMRQHSGTRSSLAFEYARLVEELRPRVILWENVPGVLSSRNGLDFRAFLGSLVERGYCCAWRVLDAQFTRTQSFPFAVPQRRRRVWLVGCLGADESAPAQILSLVEGLRGNPPPRRETGKGSTSPAGYRADRDDRLVEGAAGARQPGAGAAEGGLAAQDHRGDGTGGCPGRVQHPEGEGARTSGTVGGGGLRRERGADGEELQLDRREEWPDQRTVCGDDVSGSICAADGKGKNGQDVGKFVRVRLVRRQ